MRYIQALVTRTRQTDKIPMNLMLDAINHTLASAYGVEFESVLPTYLCDCSYKNFKTSSFHKRFNPCNNCLIIDLEKTVSRTFSYTNKSDVREKDPITEQETVFLFFPDEEPSVDINSKDKIQRGFVGEDLEGRALPKELIAEFKKEDDWDDFYGDDDSWEDYDYDVENGYSEDANEYESEDYSDGMNDEMDALAESGDETSNPASMESNPDTPSKATLASDDFDFQILQQIKSKKYILDVDQKVTVTNVDTVNLDKVPAKEEHDEDAKWISSLSTFIRCAWCRINVLLNSGDGDKELGIIANQLRLISEAYTNILFSEEESSVANEQQVEDTEDLDTTDLERELMPVLKKMVTLGKDKEAMLVSRNWLPILEKLYSVDDTDDSSNPRLSQKSSLLVADVMAVLGVLEFRRRQDGWAAQHLLESFKLAYVNALSNGESFDLFAYLGDPRLKPSSAPWLLSQREALRMSELLDDRAAEYLDLKQQWFLYESIMSYVKQLLPNMDEKELKKSWTLVNNLTKKMLKSSEALIEEDKDYYVTKVIQLYNDKAQYYASKDKWEEADFNLSEALYLLKTYPKLVPLNLKVDVLALSIFLSKQYGNITPHKISELLEASSELYSQEKDFESLKKVVEAYIEQINLDIDKLEKLSSRQHMVEDDDLDDDNDYDDWDEQDEYYFNAYHKDLTEDGKDLNDLDKEVFEEEEEWEDNEEEEEEEDMAEDEDYFDYDMDVQSRITELKQEVVKDFINIQTLIDDYKKSSSEDNEESDSQYFTEALQLLEIRRDLTRLHYINRVQDEPGEDNPMKAFELYQDLIGRISQRLGQHHNQSLYETYRDIVRASAILNFSLEKYNEVKRGYKQLITYQKNMIASMPQKGRAFQEANLDLAQTNCYLGAYYSDLKTYDHALKYAQIAQSLVDKYADTKTRRDLETKMEVYSFLYLVAKDAGKQEIADMAEKEFKRLEKILSRLK